MSVAPWNDTEANLKKVPQAYDSFCYDNTNNNLVNALETTQLTFKKVDSDIDNLYRLFGKLMSLYGSFSGYDATIEQARTALRNGSTTIYNDSHDLLILMNDTLKALIEKDNRLLNDLASINKMLNPASEEN